MKLKWFKRVLCSCFIMLALLAASSASEGAIFCVTPGGAGNESGDSWANAMDLGKFRAALEAGTKGEYWVAEGTYTPTGDTNRDKFFALKDGIALYGGFAGDETQLDERDYKTNETILSGAIGGSLHSYHVVYAENVFSTAILDGFTITGGEATGGVFGGGMYIRDSSPTLTNCTFSENEASGGGGMGIVDSSNPTLTNCTFSGNEANQYGGGMAIANNCNPTVTNTIFWGAGSAAGQVFVQPGGTLIITYSVVETAVFPGEGNTDADPKLGPLADNGGPTKTCALLEGSSAIDKGLSVGPHTIDGVKIIVPGEDQRGITRPYGVGVDIGAYERDEPPFPKKPDSSGGGCATGPSSPWMLALLAPLAPLALKRRPGRRGR